MTVEVNIDLAQTKCIKCGLIWDTLMFAICPHCNYSPWAVTDTIEIKPGYLVVSLLKIKIHTQHKEVFYNDILIWEGREYDDKLLEALGYTVETELVSAEARQRGMI